jgi:hypothetical protein
MANGVRAADGPPGAQYRTEPRPQPLVKGDPPVQKHWSVVKVEELAQVYRQHQPHLSREQAVSEVLRTREGQQLYQVYRQRTRG